MYLRTRACPSICMVTHQDAPEEGGVPSENWLGGTSTLLFIKPVFSQVRRLFGGGGGVDANVICEFRLL